MLILTSYAINMHNQGLTADKVLELEFNYVKDTANQAVDDRYKFLNFYISLTTLVGTLTLGLVSFNQGKLSDSLAIALASLFFLIAFVGWIFLAMMIRLRQAWYESIIALNRIKNYYITVLNIPLGEAFNWSQNTIPAPQRLWNISFFSTILIIVIDSVFLSAAFTLLLHLRLSVITSGIISLVISFLGLLIQIFIYRFALKRNL